MSRRSIATVRRPTPHSYAASAVVPGVCGACGLPRPNSVHEMPDPQPEQAEHRRRVGDEP